MKKIISCGKRSVNKTGPNLPDYAYFDGKEQQEEVHFFIEDKERVKDQLIHEFESEAKKYGLDSPKDTIVIDVVKLSLGMGVGVVVD